MRANPFVATVLLVVTIRAIPTFYRDGPWSASKPPPYALPDIPRDLPWNYFDDFERSDTLTLDERTQYQHTYSALRELTVSD